MAAGPTSHSEAVRPVSGSRSEQNVKSAPTPPNTVPQIWFAAAALTGFALSASLILTGCGPRTSQTTAGSVIPPSVQNAPPPTQGQAPGGLNTLSQASQAALPGYYYGTLTRTLQNWSEVTENYQFQVGIQTQTQSVVAQLQVQSIYGLISIPQSQQSTLYLKPYGPYTYSANGQTYVAYAFYSPIQAGGQFHSGPYAILFIAVFANGGSQFDQTQSSILIKDCGLSQSCMSTSQEVRFNADLVKYP